MCFSVIWSSCVNGILSIGCVTHAGINLNNNLLCLSLVLFPIPHLYAFLLTHGQPHTPCHPVNLCCPAPSGPPTYYVCDLAAVMDHPMSDLFSIPLLLYISWDDDTHPSSLIIGFSLYLMCALPSKSTLKPDLSALVDVCEHLFMCKHACTGMFDCDGKERSSRKRCTANLKIAVYQGFPFDP